MDVIIVQIQLFVSVVMKVFYFQIIFVLNNVHQHFLIIMKVRVLLDALQVHISCQIRLLVINAQKNVPPALLLPLTVQSVLEPIFITLTVFQNAQLTFMQIPNFYVYNVPLPLLSVMFNL